LGAYLFNIKREDARRALEALYLEEATDPKLVLAELRVLRFDLDEYIRSVEDELTRGSGTSRLLGRASSVVVASNGAGSQDG